MIVAREWPAPVKPLLQAVGAFAVTNIDDIVVLSLFFARAGDSPGARIRVVIGQYLGFVTILGLSVGFAGAAALLPRSALPYLGLAPLLLGLRAAWTAWRGHRRDRADSAKPEDGNGPSHAGDGRPGIAQTAIVTVANGTDNIGVYVPMFAGAHAGQIVSYVAVFLVGLGIWCLAGHLVVTRPSVARILDRWGHVIFPLALVTIGSAILVRGGAFGL